MDFSRLFDEKRIAAVISSYIPLRERLISLNRVSRLFHAQLPWLDGNFTSFVSSSVTDEMVVAFLSRHPSTVRINLSYCSKITNTSLQRSALAIHNLASLSLEGNFKNITDVGLLPIVHASAGTLEYLNLSGCAQVFTAALIEIASACRNLTSLDLSSLPNLTDPVLRALADLPRLQRLSLNSCKLTTAALGRTLPVLGTRLKYLSLHYNRQVNDAVLAAIVTGCTGLEELLLYGCHSLTDDGVRQVSRCAGLRVLDLSICAQITDRALLTALPSLPLLERLSLFNCGLITDQVLDCLITHCPRLARIDLHGCGRVSAPAAQRLLLARGPTTRLHLIDRCGSLRRYVPPPPATAAAADEEMSDVGLGTGTGTGTGTDGDDFMYQP